MPGDEWGGGLERHLLVGVSLSLRPEKKCVLVVFIEKYIRHCSGLEEETSCFGKTVTFEAKLILHKFIQNMLYVPLLIQVCALWALCAVSDPIMCFMCLMCHY